MAQAEEQIGRGAFLPLAVQNAYRERYRAIRPEWRSSGDQLEAMVRSHATAKSRVLDQSFDLIVSLWVLEHLQDPVTMLREVHRVLMPGGHFVFLTPNMRNPLMVANRIGRALPSLQRRLVPRFYGREEADTFPVRYRANTVGAIRGHAKASGLEVYDMRVVPDPTYLAVNSFMFRASLVSERLMPKGWGVHLLGDLIRP